MLSCIFQEKTKKALDQQQLDYLGHIAFSEFILKCLNILGGNWRSVLTFYLKDVGVSVA